LILLGKLLRFAALAVALLAAGPVVAGERARKPDGASVQTVGHGTPAPSFDFTTRKHRHAASLEEFLAVDDDSDEYAKSPAVVAPDITWYTTVAERQPRFYRVAPPSHWPRAAPSTGPPPRA
jgi:hypothetical protein